MLKAINHLPDNAFWRQLYQPLGTTSGTKTKHEEMPEETDTEAGTGMETDAESQGGIRSVSNSVADRAVARSTRAPPTRLTSLGDPQSCIDLLPNKIKEVAAPVHRLGWNFSFIDVLVAMEEVVLVLAQTPLKYAAINVTDSGVSIMWMILEPLL
ncbi:hypothetical protein DL768_010484 [Monosporascus sp. mg162]|nr:hypothetical protein DL768_010484 [Monosporascus sp. mg162]